MDSQKLNDAALASQTEEQRMNTMVSVRNIIEIRDKNHEKALKSLAKYKFWMFGYHAAHAIVQNRFLPKHLQWDGNPFRRLVALAEEMSNGN